MRVGELGLELQNLLVVGDRFVETALVSQSVAKVVVRLGEIGLQTQAPADNSP